MVSKYLQILTLIGFGCTTLISATVEITTTYTGDGESFAVGSDATLTCTISPYNGYQEWKVESVSVADCGFLSCNKNPSNSVRYSFMPNRTSGIFIFTISEVENADNGTVIGCFGGSLTDTDTFTIIVTGISSNSENECSCWCSKCSHLFPLCIIIIVIACIAAVIILYMVGKPGKPTEFCVITNGITEESIQVEWKPGKSGICGLKQKFIVSSRMLENNIHGKRDQHTEKHAQSRFDNLREGTYYRLTVQAVNRIGKSQESESLHVRTRGNGPPDQPTNFEVTAVTDTSIEVQWRPGYNGGFQQQFVLKKLKEENGSTIQDQPEPVMRHMFGNVSNKHNYQLTICAKNERGPAPPVCVWTKSKPNKPTDFMLDENLLTESSIAVKWKPGFNGGFPQTFKLLCKGNGHFRQIIVPDQTNQATMTYTFENLAKRTKYTISILATNRKGDSLQQVPLVVTTRGLPQKPD